MKDRMRDLFKLSPLLLFYIALIALIPHDLSGDQHGYIRFARNLTQGFYAPRDTLNLWWGPGYPLVLMPFVALDIPLVAARFMNALFLFFAVFYFYLTLRQYVRSRITIIFLLALSLGLYPPFMRHVHELITESFAMFLICGFVFHFARAIRANNAWQIHLFVSATYLAILALTKVIFGYVMLPFIFICLILFMVQRNPAYSRALLISCVALTLCSPYLLYTYSITGKIYYWGNSGGMNLYWMSTPHDGEYGDWHYSTEVYTDHNLWENHHEFFDTLDKKNLVHADDQYKSKAINNIMEHPRKYVFNILCNIGRMIFSYPFSYTLQKPSTFFYMIPVMPILVFFSTSLFLVCMRVVYLPVEHFLLLALTAIYLGGSVLLCAVERQFTIMVPIFLLVTFCTIESYANRRREPELDSILEHKEQAKIG